MKLALKGPVPGLQPQFFFGNLLQTGILSGKPLFQVWSAFQQKYGDVFQWYFGQQRVLLFNRIEHAQYILGNRQLYDLSVLTEKTFGLLFPRSLLAIKGSMWKRHARVMLPMLKKAKIVPYLQTIVDCIDNLIQKWRDESQNHLYTNIVNDAQDSLLNVIGIIAFDYDLKNSTMVHAFNDVISVSTTLILLGGLPEFMGRLYLRFNSKYQRGLQLLRQHINDIIKQEQQRIKNNGTENRRKNLVSLLVSSLVEDNEILNDDSKQGLTRDELFDEVFLSVLGGFETSATTISWFIYYMSKYPDIQQRIKQELRSKNITQYTVLTSELVDELVYVDCVMKELFRFAPVQPGVGRSAQEDDEIDGIKIKRGDVVLIGTHNIHHDKRVWSLDPDKFIPERFLQEDKTYPPYAMLLFGAGHRACAGQDLARFELKLIIVRLMQFVTFIDGGKDNSGGYLQRITVIPKHLAVYMKFDTT
ncbi:unnamed protein product [Didymodactylos carnosus]|uniref:Cytochrome P450 n=1 Tax=Didymodactylos carnosus TaxID=1234261 RepID=A0A815K5H3_9BILA|nr:unnamed protein product [Didymodactylos carnosus]CAF4281568.1 unnamed protein product [Didymodactylos carnosus]